MKASLKAQRDVAAAGRVVSEGTKTDGRVVVAGGVARERERSVGRVEAAGGVVKKGLSTGSRVVDADGVAKKRERSIGRVEGASGVIKSAPAPEAVF